MNTNEVVTTAKPAALEWVDGTRSIAAMAVVLLHVAANAVVDRSLLGTSAWWAANILDSATRWCVPVFVMLSGALLLSPSKAAESSRDFFRKRIGRVLIPLLFWALFYLAYQLYPAHAAGEVLPWQQLWQQTRIGMPYFHLWFMFMLLGLYAVTPLLRQWMVLFSPKQLLIVCGILFALAMANTLHSVWQHRSPPLAPLIFLPYIAYFIAGYLITVFTIAKKWAWIMWILAVVATAYGCAAWATPDSMHAAMYFYEYFSISTVPAGLAAFALCMHLSQRLIWSKIAPLSLGIYLIHPMVLDQLWQYGVRPTSWHPALAISLIFIVALLISALLSALLLRLPYLRRVV